MLSRDSTAPASLSDRLQTLVSLRCSARLKALRIHIRFRSFAIILKVNSPAPRQHIQRVMISPCVSTAGIGFLEHPVPAEGLALLCSRVTQVETSNGVALFRTTEIQ